MSESPSLSLQALERLLTELLEGAPPDASYVLNQGDRGFLASLDTLPAHIASMHPGGRSSVAAHVAHLHYGFQLLNRWRAGEHPWAAADWTLSWQRQEVTEEEWRGLRQAFTQEARAWRSALRQARAWDAESMTIAIANAVHLAYHVGAVRQIQQALSGPTAEDERKARASTASQNVGL